MITLNCKMCGGRMDVTENTSIFECEYCRSLQTIPATNDERIMHLHDRAIHHLHCSEFDKASIVYENILAENAQNAEAHWGLCLCRYGIEYVEDVRTHKRIPTCHRAQFKSILEDPEYLAALEYADPGSRVLYREEAEYIDKVQKDILSISAKEEPFDIFICYKETDDDTGARTKDSVLAQNLYNALTKEGYKVFFARITLESKLGTAYEPYIFAALNSASVMLVIGSKPAYFNAVWVKNEWNRYISLIEQGQKKTLIPCYFDMSPYDLPDAFMHLQAQDMSKLGYEQDLIRGIGKIAEKKNRSITAKAQESVKEVAFTGALYVGDAVAGKPHGKGRAVYDGTNPENLPDNALPNFRGDEYDGEWNFGERDGKGTYTYRDGGSWSGIWKDGKPWTGHGKLRFQNGDVYEGGLENNVYHGKGAITLHGDSEGDSVWSGEWKHGAPWTGEGFIGNQEGFCWYRGRIVEGKFEGEGQFCSKQDLSKSLLPLYFVWRNHQYDGQYRNGLKHGQGTLQYIYKCNAGKGAPNKENPNWSGEWSGEFKDDRPWNGSGFHIYETRNEYNTPVKRLYVGELKNGQPNGRGIMVYFITDEGYVSWYEGNFKDGKPDGEGEKRAGDSFYRGSWKNGELNGYGEYISSDGSFYKGGWKNGKYDGKGELFQYTYSEGIIAYEQDGKGERQQLTYKGGWKDGKYDGYGIITHADGTSYGGNWKDGVYHGQGTCRYADGTVWEGEWQDGACVNGCGFQKLENGETYDGELKNGKREGMGTCHYKDGKTYEGEWKDNVRHGKGILRWADGICSYDGDWENDKRCGHGVMIYTDGTYTGAWHDDKRNGQGVFVVKNGKSDQKWEGEWKDNNKYTGYGYQRYNNGVYYGDWKEGNRTGSGSYYWDSGVEYTGEFLNNKMHGKGTHKSAAGDVYEGEFKNNFFDGEGTLTYASGGENAKWIGTWKEGRAWEGTGLIRNYNSGIKDCREQRFYGQIIQGKAWMGTLRYIRYDARIFRAIRDFQLGEEFSDTKYRSEYDDTRDESNIPDGFHKIAEFGPGFSHFAKIWLSIAGILLVCALLFAACCGAFS